MSIALVAGLLVGSVILVGLRLSRPAQREVGAPPSELAGAHDVAFPSASGTTIHGWWMEGRPGGGVVLLVHGIWGNRLSMVRRAQHLSGKGFGVLLFDLQGHGESQGRRITFGAAEGRDVEAALAYARRKAPAEKVGVVGASLGGAAAVLQPGPAPDALVLEAVFPDLDSALLNRLRVALGPALGTLSPLLKLVFRAAMPFVVGVRMSDLRPADAIGALHVPVLILAGTEDDRTTLAEARRIFDGANEPKLFQPVPGAGHVDLEGFDPPGYWPVIDPFLTRYLKASRPDPAPPR